MRRGHAHRRASAEPAGAHQGAGGGLPAGAHALVLVAPFVSGAAIMALELVGLRLLAPTFGSSSYVWGGTLAVIMAALAAGYLLGGALADRRPRAAWLFALLLAAAGWVLLDLLLAGPVLAAGERLGATRGPIVATLVLLGVPMVLLSSVSPFVIRLDARLATIGTTAGRIYALSTAGSLAGTFLAAFWWIPDYGSRASLRIVIGVLAATGVAGLAWPRARWARAAVAAGLIAGAAIVPDPPLGPGVVFAAESPYNSVFVEERMGARLLRLNGGGGFHSVRLAGTPLTGIYYDVLLLGPHLAGGRDLLILGMGGGTTVSGYRRFYPGARITAVEIDPVVVRAAHEQMGLVAGDDLEVRIADARPFLARDTRSFDLIEVDVFAGGPYAPFYCLTREFFAAAARRLAPEGVLAMNVYAPGGDRALTEAVVATLAEVFPSVLEVPLSEESVLFAFRSATTAAAARERLAAADLPAGLGEVARRTAAGLAPARPGGAGVLTDDRAPVEATTHAMLARRARRLGRG
jgi:spermidine synthase